MNRDVRVLVDTLAAAEAVNRPPGTIRRWAHEGLITARGRDRRGRTLYALADVYRAERARREVITR